MRLLKISLSIILILSFFSGCAHAVKNNARPSRTDAPAVKQAPAEAPVVKETPRSARGVYHQVKKGETLWSISRAYKMNIQELAERNHITNISQIKEGSVLFIPNAEKVIEIARAPALQVPPPDEPDEEEPPREPEKVEPAPGQQKITAKDLRDPEPPKTPAPLKPAVTAAPAVKDKPDAKPENKAESKPAAVTPPPPPPPPPPSAPAAEKKDDADRTRFAWPVKGTVSLKFGVQPNGMKINGINILAPDDSPIKASASGAVIYSASLKYFGDTVIIKHDDNYSTVYTYLKDRTVKVGDIIKKGDMIALLGKPENGDGRSYLHFEIRYQSKPRDPLLYLP